MYIQNENVEKNIHDSSKRLQLYQSDDDDDDDDDDDNNKKKNKCSNLCTNWQLTVDHLTHSGKYWTVENRERRVRPFSFLNFHL